MTTPIDLWLENHDEEKTISEELIKLNKVQRNLDKEKKKNRNLVRLIEELEEQESLIFALSEKEQELSPIISSTNSLQAEATAVALASDWHVEEQVDPESVNGMNSYNPEIAEQRSTQFFQALLWQIRSARSGESQEYGFLIENLVLWFGGDLITGYIHEELMESNYLSPVEAIRFCTKLLCSGINFLLKEGGLKRIQIPCSYGNHGRTTMKRKVSTSSRNSFEWLMYHQLKQIYEKEDRVEFLIANGSHLYLDIYDWTFRFHHGDDIRYGGGTGGLAVPLRKATDAWNIGRYADITCIGHFHQFVDENFAVVNGSLIGYNAFAQSIKARYEPPRQAFFLVDRDRGKKMVSPLYVDPSQRRMPSGKYRP